MLLLVVVLAGEMSMACTPASCRRPHATATDGWGGSGTTSMASSSSELAGGCARGAMALERRSCNGVVEAGGGATTADELVEGLLLSSLLPERLSEGGVRATLGRRTKGLAGLPAVGVGTSTTGLAQPPGAAEHGSGRGVEVAGREGWEAGARRL